MKYLKFIFLSIGIGLGIFSCASGNTEYLTVASKKADCIGVSPQKCLLVKEDGVSDWTFLYQDIQGFNYEEGNEYMLKIKKEKLENVPADASSLKYILVKEISKTKKNSTNLP